MSAGLCFVDTETTGLDPYHHEVWEVGLIMPNGEERLWHLTVDLGRADPMALTISGYHDRFGKGGQQGWKPRFTEGDVDEEAWRPFVSPESFAVQFASLTRGLHLAGAVVSFDAERLFRLLRKHHQCPMWNYHLIDVEALAAGWVGANCVGQANDGVSRGTVTVEVEEGVLDHITGRPPWSSDVLSRAVGVNPDDFDRHTALGDCRWAKAIYEAVMGS